MSKFNSKNFNTPSDQSANKDSPQVDFREDEEQNTKLQEIIELLVAAGYFRARIKGLTAFDKIVGGMTWCITTCNMDVDVDLLFQESSTIGQKIALVERIVSVLPYMKCPHAIEPHQIQGLDFINIFPVIQWLVLKAIETRAEMGDLNRSYAVAQFRKMNIEHLPEASVIKIESASRKIVTLRGQHAPERKYIRKGLSQVSDRHVKIQSTLLEYGQQNILSSAVTQSNQEQKQQQQSKMALKQQADEEMDEARLKMLINDMSSTDQKKNKLTSNAVGQILGLQQSALLEILNDYTSKENELQQEIEQLEKLGSDLPISEMQQKKRLINAINKQTEQKNDMLMKKKAEIDALKTTLNETNERLAQLLETDSDLKTELSKLVDFETNTEKKFVEELQRLVLVHESLKNKEQEYKKTCKEKMQKMGDELEKLNASPLGGITADEQEKYDKVNEQYETAKSRHQAVRLKLAKKNRELSVLKRKLDEIPSSTELNQYQKRFIELYNQISAVHTQTKQFYVFYNVLEDKKMFMTKEISLLNSIHDQFGQAMQTQNNREQFLKQLETILEGIKKNLQRLDDKKIDVKTKRDKLNDKYIELIETKRIYYKAIKEFQDECKNNELLISKLESA